MYLCMYVYKCVCMYIGYKSCIPRPLFRIQRCRSRIGVLQGKKVASGGDCLACPAGPVKWHGHRQHLDLRSTPRTGWLAVSRLAGMIGGEHGAMVEPLSSR